MSFNALELVCWNVRGLNSPAKRKALRGFVDSTRAAIVFILETKLEVVDTFVILQCMGPNYDGFTYLPASDTRGGIFVAWDITRVLLSNYVNDSHSISAYVSPKEGEPWWLTVVYGPQEDERKINFLNELSERRSLCPGPWLVLGDFNLILYAADKNNSNLDALCG